MLHSSFPVESRIRNFTKAEASAALRIVDWLMFVREYGLDAHIVVTMELPDSNWLPQATLHVFTSIVSESGRLGDRSTHRN
jgi:hypothetical protein